MLQININSMCQTECSSVSTWVKGQDKSTCLKVIMDRPRWKVGRPTSLCWRSKRVAQVKGRDNQT